MLNNPEGDFRLKLNNGVQNVLVGTQVYADNAPINNADKQSMAYLSMSIRNCVNGESAKNYLNLKTILDRVYCHKSSDVKVKQHTIGDVLNKWLIDLVDVYEAVLCDSMNDLTIPMSFVRYQNKSMYYTQLVNAFYWSIAYNLCSIQLSQNQLYSSVVNPEQISAIMF